MMFRAQVDGRCQLQRIRTDKVEPDVIRWVSEWIEKAHPKSPNFSDISAKLLRFLVSLYPHLSPRSGIASPLVRERAIACRCPSVRDWALK